VRGQAKARQQIGNGRRRFVSAADFFDPACRSRRGAVPRFGFKPRIMQQRIQARPFIGAIERGKRSEMFCGIKRNGHRPEVTKPMDLCNGLQAKNYPLTVKGFFCIFFIEGG
jgi:hypothetical protein